VLYLALVLVEGCLGSHFEVTVSDRSYYLYE
jgi:hypothetical protein